MVSTETAPTATTRRRTPAFALLVANAISTVGSMLTLIALPWFVLATTGSAGKTGLTAFFVALPGFLAGIFGGTLVDRLGYKRVSIIADLVSGLGIMLIPLLYDTVGLAFWELQLLVFIGALLEIPGLTARRSLLPELASRAGLRLEQINAAFESIQSVALLVGPPLAGLLIAWLSAANVLWLDALSFAASAVIVGALVPSPPVEAARAAAGRYLDELKAGLRFLRADRLLFTLAVSVGVSNFLSGPIFAVVLPVYVKDVFDSPTVLGLLASTFGVGALAGALVYGATGHRLPRRALWISSFLAFALPIWVMLLTQRLPLLMASAVLSGFLSGPINPLMVTVRHERIPLPLRGRVFATFSAITAVATPLGMVLSGATIERLGMSPTLAVLGIGVTAVGLAMFFLPVLREMDVRRGSEA